MLKMSAYYMTAYYTLIATLGLVFNTLILVSVQKYKTLRKKQYTILVSLAVCDLLKVVVIVNMIVYSLVENTQQLCEYTSTLGTTLLFINTLHLAAESINRVFMIYSPYKYLTKLTRCSIASLIMLLWLLPAIIIAVIPIPLYGGDWRYHMYFQLEMFACSQTSKHPKDGVSYGRYPIVVHVLFLAIPLAVMFVSYSFMLKTSCSNAKNIRAVSLIIPEQPAVKESTYSTSIINMVTMSYDTMSPQDYLRFPQIKHRSNTLATRASQELKRIMSMRRMEIKAAKTILLIIAAFIICNTPVIAITWYDHSNEVHPNSHHYNNSNPINSPNSYYNNSNKEKGGVEISTPSNSHRSIRLFLLSVAMWQVCIDPVIYIIRLKDFQRIRRACLNLLLVAFRKIFRR